MNTYVLAENEDSASEPPPALPVHYQATIGDLETCLLHSLYTDRSMRQLEGMLQKEKCRSS